MTKLLRALAIAGSLSGVAGAQALRLEVQPLGSSTTTAGGELEFVIRAQVHGVPAGSGLAALRFDLRAPGMTLSACEPSPESSAFRSPLGHSNPAPPDSDRTDGFGGTEQSGGLVQVGGLQSTWRRGAGKALEPASRDVGIQAPVEWVRGRVTLPKKPGRYTCELRNVSARVFAGAGAEEARNGWVTRPVAEGAFVSWVATVGADGALSIESTGGALHWAPIAALQPRMGEPLAGLDAEAQRKFYAGRAAFMADILPKAGLGPIFNDKACVVCHAKPAPGGFSAFNVVFFGRDGDEFDPMLESGGPLHQAKSISMKIEEFIPPDAQIVSERTTPHLFGIGLIEQLTRSQLLEVWEQQPADVAGRIHHAPALEDPSVDLGRFGWKAHVSSVLSFSAIASRDELGFTNRLVPEENAPNGDVENLARNDVAEDPEDHPDARGFAFIDRVAHFQRLLAPPPQTPPWGMPGERVFRMSGCVECHTSDFQLDSAPHPSLPSGAHIRPYSDFMLHDMGELGDGIAQGQATGKEFRTAPLWGINQRVALLHDASVIGGTFAEKAFEAIRRHDGQARRSRNAFLARSEEDRAALIAFLASLGRPDFDADDDNDVDSEDWLQLAPHFGGPLVRFEADNRAAIADVDRDGDFDLADLELFQAATAID